MKKSHLIILILAGIFSFASAFSVSWFLKKKKLAALAAQKEQQQLKQIANAKQDGYANVPYSTISVDRMEKSLSERQLQNLIYDVRNRLKECEERQIILDKEEERIQISRESLQKDIERFNTLRDKLNISLLELREKEESLKQSITEINAIEKANFQHLASTYEKMDSTQAGRIMISMASNNQLQDPVKILYYMNERMAGKLLSEIATAKPDLASLLCSKLKLVKETE